MPKKIIKIYNENDFCSLRLIRVVSNRTVKEIADAFKVTSAYICAIENGKRVAPERTIYFGLKELGIELDDFKNMILTSDLSYEEKYALALSKAIAVVSPELKPKVNELIIKALKK